MIVENSCMCLIWILIIEKVIVLRWSWAFDILPIVSLLRWFHIVSIPVLTFCEGSLVIVMKMTLNGRNPAIIREIIAQERFTFSNHLIGRHISIAIDPVHIRVLVISLKKLIMDHVRYDSSGRFGAFRHESLVWDELIDVVHVAYVANVIDPEGVHLLFVKSFKVR